MKKKTKLLIRDSFLSTILSCILALLLILTVKNISFFNPFVEAISDFSLLDTYYSEKFKSSDKINTDIVLINIKNLERDELGFLINRVIENNPKVIGLDVIFQERKEDAFSDSLLKGVLKDKSIVNAFNILDYDIIENHSYFKNNNPEGYVNFSFDKTMDDGYIIRRFLGIHSNQEDYTSFASQVSKQYLGEEAWNTLNYDKKLKRERLIKYYGNYNKFVVLDIDDFLDYEKVPILNDKIVLVGYLGSPNTGNVNDILDKYFTPLNEYHVGKSDKDMFGVVVHANIVNMLINNDFMFEVSSFVIALLTFISMFFTTLYLIKIDKRYKVSYRTRKQTILFIYYIVLVGIALLLLKYNFVIDVAPIIVGTLFAGSYVKYYKHVVRYVKTKRKWKTYVK
jgi:CHASE2 domain-containing sensor protein